MMKSRGGGGGGGERARGREGRGVSMEILEGFPVLLWWMDPRSFEDSLAFDALIDDQSMD